MTNNKKYHALTVEETVKSLETDPKSGLSSSEAGVRLNKCRKKKGSKGIKCERVGMSCVLFTP